MVTPANGSTVVVGFVRVTRCPLTCSSLLLMFLNACFKLILLLLTFVTLSSLAIPALSFDTLTIH